MPDNRIFIELTEPMGCTSKGESEVGRIFIPKHLVAQGVRVVTLDAGDPAPVTYYHGHGAEHPIEILRRLENDKTYQEQS